MSSRLLVRTSLLALLGITLGCGESSPTGPSQETIPGIPTAFITFVSPNTGSTVGGTRVTISGSGFQSGATVTLDGAATNVSVISSTAITATTPAHAAGTVDVVVTTPGGQSGRLTGGYTYAGIPPASITAVSPNTGSTGGSTTVTITGTGFQPGTTVTLDGTPPSYVWVRNSTTLQFSTPAHAAGAVDIVLTNPGSQAATLSRGYTYASPLSFDFNGNWEGAAGPELWESAIRFTIQNNVLVNVSCGTSGTFTPSPPPSVSNGEFSFLGNDGVAISGRIVAASAAVGMINIAPCTATHWWAEKSQGTQRAALR
jgi:IPT/TIG domain-containing protein